jgi:hypothetical protein
MIRAGSYCENFETAGAGRGFDLVVQEVQLAKRSDGLVSLVTLQNRFHDKTFPGFKRLNPLGDCWCFFHLKIDYQFLPLMANKFANYFSQLNQWVSFRTILKKVLPDLFLRFNFRPPQPHVPRVVFGRACIKPGKLWPKLVFAPGAIGREMFRVVEIFVLHPA